VRKAVPLVDAPRHATIVEQKPDRGERQCLWSGSRVLNAKNAEKQWHCGSSNLKDPVSIPGLSSARNVLAPKPWWRRSPAKRVSPARHRGHQQQRGHLGRHDASR
jgi:hypothetical protein